jgi:predicted enzyme related to lactoylglutathione lyase
VTTFAHVNIAAQNWRALANFYIDVFGCEPAGPERDLSKGQHLRLPGHGPEGPTLEIFQYEAMEPRPDMHANTPGLTHLCFRMDDVAACAERFIQRGGSPVGPLTVSEVAGVGTLTFQYMRDPEGNIVEIQNWS